MNSSGYLGATLHRDSSCEQEMAALGTAGVRCGYHTACKAPASSTWLKHLLLAHGTGIVSWPPLKSAASIACIAAAQERKRLQVKETRARSRYPRRLRTSSTTSSGSGISSTMDQQTANAAWQANRLRITGVPAVLKPQGVTWPACRRGTSVYKGVKRAICSKTAKHRQHYPVMHGKTIVTREKLCFQVCRRTIIVLCRQHRRLHRTS